MDFAVPTDHKGKLRESEKIDKIHGSCQRTEKTVEHESVISPDFSSNLYERFTRSKVIIIIGSLK